MVWLEWGWTCITCEKIEMNRREDMIGVMRKGPYLSKSQFSENDVKVCEFWTSKSRHVDLLAAFDLYFLNRYIVLTEFQYEKNSCTCLKGTH